MLHDPQVLFLDEPTTAMDPQSARVVRAAITDLRDARRVIVLCTHNLSEAEMLADRIAVIRSGRIIAYGTAGELTRDLLGEPVWELRTVHPIDRAVEHIRDLVAIEQPASDRIRYRTTQPSALNPVLLERLHAAGVAVVSLGEVPRSLESVYLRIVGDSGVMPGEPGATP
jgi:ABC-2 type transport system ATP-binding protein